MPSRTVLSAHVISPTQTIFASEVDTLSSITISSSFEELAHHSALIVIGQVVGKEKVVNTAHDLNDLCKPDPEFFSINQVYSVKVERVLKGKTPQQNRLLLVQNQGGIQHCPDQTLSMAEIDTEIANNEGKTFLPLSSDKRYLFFLRILDRAGYDLNGYHSTEIYAGASEPWLFVFAETGEVVPESILPAIETVFPPQDLAAIIAEINQRYDPDATTPYP